MRVEFQSLGSLTSMQDNMTNGHSQDVKKISQKRNFLPKDKKRIHQNDPSMKLKNLNSGSHFKFLTLHFFKMMLSTINNKEGKNENKCNLPL